MNITIICCLIDKCLQSYVMIGYWLESRLRHDSIKAIINILYIITYYTEESIVGFRTSLYCVKVPPYVCCDRII